MSKIDRFTGVFLLPIFRVNDNRYGAIVQEGHVHVGPELAGLNWLTEVGAELGNHAFVKWDSHVGPGGFDETGAIAFLVLA